MRSDASNASTFDAALGNYAESLSGTIRNVEDVSSELRSYVGSLILMKKLLKKCRVVWLVSETMREHADVLVWKKNLFESTG